MDILRMLFGLFVSFAAIILAVNLEGGRLAFLVRFPGFIVLGAIIGVTIIAFPFDLIIQSVRVLFKKRLIFQMRAKACERVFRTIGNASVMIGIAGTVMGIIYVMENLDKPEQIGPGIAFAFVYLLFGFGIKILFADPFADIIFSKSVEQNIGLANATDAQQKVIVEQDDPSLRLG